MSNKPLVYVVDDDEPVRDAISMLLDTVGLEHESYADAQSFLNAYDPAQPGCLILDIRMPGISGLDLQDRLLEMQAPIPIIFITGHGDIPMAVEAMRKGAVDFIRKPFRDQELLDQVNGALASGQEQQAEHDLLAAAKARITSLTPREHEVFGRVADGQANKVIALDLGISERTVEIHRSQVMQKTGSRSLADLVRLKLQTEKA
ncbi:MAG: response regulator transcription factor [Pseudomonadales bacterium]